MSQTTMSLQGRGKSSLSKPELQKLDALWRASNYLSVGQIYLLDNPLLRKPLERAHVKPRLLGHWGTTPGLNFLYVHLNRVINERDLNMIYVIGPGHGGPALVAHAYLEGTYSEVYPDVSQDEEGLRKLFRQFSFPGGIPSHVAPETPGSIHEGGELGYALSHAYGAAFDNPDLIVACVVGDGEAETGPLATGWHGNKFLNPARDGCVLPILHLNGYKIANPCFLARIPKDELAKLFEGYGYKPYFVEGHEPAAMHAAMAETLDAGRRRDPGDPGRGARERGAEAAGLADDRAADAEGLDLPARDRRQALRGLLAQPSGPDGGDGSARALGDPRAVDEELPPGGALRRAGRARSRARRPRAPGRAADERQPARERRAPPEGAAAAGLPRLRGRGPEPRRSDGRGDPPPGPVSARRDAAEPRAAELPALQSGREQLQPLAGRPRGHRPLLHGRDPARGRPPVARRSRDGGALASTSARDGWRATCSPDGTASSVATRPSSTSSTPCSTSTRSG